ncbi:hypothetical protein [Nocardia stercoris]|uniref:DUF2336 domain-containing protein n=1 Tax=Nocardia stercoris TaxID=2483361 RepID=A0A3M2L5L6_9NOCA|nr:hypothetical protein [Nocardia stercoris]RMI32949.1 hypothetical protein EBN03_13665 [Nocardia stercoris]
MSETRYVTRELDRLSKILGVGAAELADLATLPHADLRAFRVQLVAHLRAAEQHRFQRLAKLASKLPAKLVAQLTERLVPPSLAARVVEAVDPAFAVAMADKLPVGYISAIARNSDPSALGPILRAMPARVVKDVTLDLLGRDALATAGEFAPHLPPQAVTQLADALDGAALLRLALEIDPPKATSTLIARLNDPVLDKVTRSVASGGQWEAVSDLSAQIDDTQLRRMAARVAAAPAPVRDAYAAAVADGRLTGPLAAIVGLPAAG